MAAQLVRPGGGFVFLDGTATAGTATLSNNGGVANGASGGVTIFFTNSAAGSSTLIANGGNAGSTGATAGFGGSVLFLNDSTGDTSRVQVFGTGNLDISQHNPPGITIGSIEGNGTAFVGANNLTVGTNNSDTTFSGTVQDFGTNGSFTKTGTGVLTLEGGTNNDYFADTVTLILDSGTSTQS